MPDSHVEHARTLTREQFVARYAGYFLVKRAKHGSAVNEAPSQFGFATVASKLDIDPFAREWQVFPVVKRPGNPFPERMTVGRATNCDIVLRVPFVSKVHAHILVDAGGRFSLHDNRPSNGTFHNHRRLNPGETRALALGDCVGFGSLECEFVDAVRLYDVLKSEAVDAPRR